MTIDNILQQIRGYRAIKKVSQKQLAERLGISLTAYSKIERGITTLTVNHVIEIANVLNVSPQELFCGAHNTSARLMPELSEGITAEKEQLLEAKFADLQYINQQLRQLLEIRQSDPDTPKKRRK